MIGIILINAHLHSRFYVDIFLSMADSAMLFNFQVKHIKIIIYSILQDNSLLFSQPHLAISVLASFKPEVGHICGYYHCIV